MPLGRGTYYRFRKVNGGKQRLAFSPSGKVREVVNYSKKGKRGKTVLTGK